MEKNFIKVNNTIFDYKQYIREVEWLKYDVKRRLLEILEKDFIVLKDIEETYDKLSLSLYNKRFDFNVELQCYKKDREVFV